MYDFQEIQNLKNNSNDIYWEPSLIVRGGFQNFRAPYLSQLEDAEILNFSFKSVPGKIVSV